MGWLTNLFEKEDPLLKAWEHLQATVPGDIVRFGKSVEAFAAKNRANNLDPMAHLGSDYVASMTKATMIDIRLKVAENSVKLLPDAWQKAVKLFEAGNLQEAVAVGQQVKQLITLSSADLQSQ